MFFRRPRWILQLRREQQFFANCELFKQSVLLWHNRQADLLALDLGDRDRATDTGQVTAGQTVEQSRLAGTRRPCKQLMVTHLTLESRLS